MKHLLRSKGKGGTATPRAAAEPMLVSADNSLAAQPAPSRSIANQASLVAAIARELAQSGLEPHAVVVNETSTAILLPAGAAQPALRGPPRAHVVCN